MTNTSTSETDNTTRLPLPGIFMTLGFLGIGLLATRIAMNYGTMIEMVSFFCGLTYILTFHLFCWKYSKLIWIPYYALPRDDIFIIIYAIVSGVYYGLLFIQPEYWSLYLIAIFLVVFLRKKYGRDVLRLTLLCNSKDRKTLPNQDAARLQYAETFTFTFLVGGLILTIGVSFLLMILLWLGHSAEPQLAGIARSRWVYCIVSVSFTLISMWFWTREIMTTIELKAKKLHNGDVQYFEARLRVG